MPASYEVMSEHYEGDTTSKAEKIAPEDIKSMTGLPISVSSSPYGDYKPSFVKGKGGKVYAATRTANNLFLTPLEDYSKHGFFSQMDDFNRFEEWVSAGEDNFPNKHDLIRKMNNIAYIEDITPRRMSFPNPRDTAVELYTTPELVNAVDINKVGYFVSKAGNLHNFLRSDVLFDDANRFHYDISEWIDFLDKKGFSIEKSKNEEFSGLGVEVDVANEKYVAGYFPAKGHLIVEENFHDNLEKLMYLYGVSGSEAVEARMRATLLHEIGHRLGIEGDRRGEELEGELLAEFYSKLAENFRGTDFEGIYKALAQQESDYAKSFSLSNKIWSEINAELFPKRLPGAIALLADKFESEADALELSGWNKVMFVEGRLREVYGELLKEVPSHKQSISDKKQLEEIIQDNLNEKVEIKTESDTAISE